MHERLQKFMARSGIASRRRCERLIEDGLVKVNGEVVTILGTKVDPNKDEVEIDGKTLKLLAKKVYMVINKPAGYLTTSDDPFERPTIMDLIDVGETRVFSVGRLDRDSEGLLLLTNDGELAFRLTHPKFKVEKTYLAEVRGHPGETILSCLRRGIIVGDRLTLPAEVDVIERKEDSTLIEITITEGRKRQVKKMFDKVGYPCVRLKRVSFGPLKLGELRSGECRFLYTHEIDELLEAVDLR